MDITPGTLVRIVPEWQDDPSEAAYIYVVIEHRGDRLLIEWQSGGPHAWELRPTSVVNTFMVEAVAS